MFTQDHDARQRSSNSFRQIFWLRVRRFRSKPGSLIIDVSCDEGMGLFFANPTAFENTMFKVDTVDYYAVDLL